MLSTTTNTYYLKDVIESIKHQITLLDKNVSIQCLSTIMKEYQGVDWKEKVKYDKDKYYRNILYQDNHFEFVLVGWGPLQGTAIHSHAQQGCLYKILDGSIIETRYNKNIKPIQKIILKINDISYIDNDIAYHKMVNPTTKGAVSLHLYAPGVYKVNFFEEN